ncbi:MAG TPA: nucleoside triphosphate pyrophosphohydrolase [Bacillota bacterium]|nr:nucleoside triphosphate pyrophosphohydrolase [Bacillota bacterium]
MPVYNKLVRDRIPEIIEKVGKRFTTRVLDTEEYKIELQKKMKEEFSEYIESDSDQNAIEELADLLEVIYALAEVHGSSLEELQAVQKDKAEKRGAFQERYFLIEVEDEQN